MRDHIQPAEEWNTSLNGDYLWSNTNFGEAVGGVMTPLTWSVIRFTLADWVFLPGHETVGNIGGRPYVNASIFAILFNTRCRYTALTCSDRGPRAGHPGCGWLWGCHHVLTDRRPRPGGQR